MPGGRYFLIKSFLNGKVLDITHGNSSPGATVAMYNPNGDGTDNQLWTYHAHTNTIRSKLNGFCLDVKGGNLEMHPYSHRVQKWRIDGQKIAKLDDPNQVLDVAGASKEDGARICVDKHHGGSNQCWRKEHKRPSYFYIKSRLNGKVLDIKNGDRSRGAVVVMWERGRSHQDNQLWYEDEEGYIRSKLNEYGFDSSGHSITMHPLHHKNHHQQWQIDGDFIVNHAQGDRVLDVKGARRDDGADLCADHRHGNNNQRWEFENV